MKAYDVISYLLEHAENGSIAALTTEDNVPILLSKNDKYSFTAYICTQNGEVKTIKKIFDKTTFHRAVLDFIDEAEDYIGKEINDVKISDIALFTNCIPKKEERKPKEKKDTVPELVSELRKVSEPFYVVPLISDKGKLVAYVPEIGAIDYFDFMTNSVSLVNGKVQPVNPNLKSLYLVLFTNKLDPHNGNILTTLDDLTFFTSVFIDNGDKGKGEFNGKSVNKRLGRFFLSTYKGGLRTEELEFFDLSSLNKGRLYVGLFVRKGDKILRIGGFSLVDFHNSEKLEINEYLFSSFSQSAKNGILDFTNYDRLFSNFLNLAISKSDARSLLKDVIEIHSMMIDMPFALQNINNQISIVDPISFWYYSTKGEDIKECVDCPLKDKVNLRKEIFNIIRKRGWFNAFFL
ncbi:hypothetical protein [Acidianus sp. HS-5]|uniref:hypothetical protein n=1 Tax=Acidianus sp. HS-5 TaxID=2886040 RepID=UPI001F21EE9E|nr:hypothetical protein [Acidianus sp. HS-5]BDC19424.1 hypothetical protein HS5_23140 [Acidianus sp. HS-5]